jgi:hypothetical protein
MVAELVNPNVAEADRMRPWEMLVLFRRSPVEAHGRYVTSELATGAALLVDEIDKHHVLGTPRQS